MERFRASLSARPRTACESLEVYTAEISRLVEEVFPSMVTGHRGRPLTTGVGPPGSQRPSIGECEDEMLNFCTNLSSVLSDIHRQVKDALPKPHADALQDLKPDEWIML
ncbi:hypothetical protein QTP86_009208 [Hemibagrus guttatus]|nr:hypothetical protein QTP86_009208 [Hemibagrus guttatus]